MEIQDLYVIYTRDKNFIVQKIQFMKFSLFFFFFSIKCKFKYWI